MYIITSTLRKNIMTNQQLNLVNITKGYTKDNIDKPNSRYIVINNVAIDGFFIGSGKSTTIDSVCFSLLSSEKGGWKDVGKLGGSNLRLLRYEEEEEESPNTKTRHYCLVCDDAYATCSLPDDTTLTTTIDTFTNHNTKNFLNMQSPNKNHVEAFSYFCAKINSQNILNAAYGQLINCGLNELITKYIKTFSTDYNTPTNIILLYSREIDFAQIQFTLAGVLDKEKCTKSIVLSAIDRIDKTIIDKPFNYGARRNHLIVYYDRCHAFYTRGLADRTEYARLCFRNITERARQFETSYFNSFKVFKEFFNFYQDEDEKAEKILEIIYNLRNNRDDAYVNSWSHDDESSDELSLSRRNSLSFDETVEKIVQKVANEINSLLLCGK